MSAKRKKQNNNYGVYKAESEKPKAKLWIILVSVFAAAILIFGAVMGIIIAVTNANAVFSYNGINLSRGVTNYIASVYKYEYLSRLNKNGISATDTEGFWNSVSPDGKPYAVHLENGAEQYIREFLCAVSLYDNYGRLTSEERSKLNNACNEVLVYKAGGSVDRFNTLASVSGFDYSDFKTATTLMYKASKAQDLIYGADGKNMLNIPTRCEHYLNLAYSHVQLLFIRTENKMVTDTEGNVEFIDLTDEEKEERQNIISYLDSMILAREEGADTYITPEMFSIYQRDHGEGDASKRETGYYFSRNSEYAQEFSEAYETVVDASIKMDLFTYKKVKTNEGVCFIYKYENEDRAYVNPLLADFFTDFYQDGANYNFSEQLTVLSEEVTVKDKFKEISLVSLPLNYDLIAVFN